MQELSPCSLWTGCLNSKGYGVRTVNAKRKLSHRYAYEQEYGPIPKGAQIHHLCGERRCVEPERLVVVTATEHNRLHVAGGAAGDAIEELLSDGLRRRAREIVRALGGKHSPDAVRNVLDRSPLVNRVGYGVYAISSPGG